MDPGIGGELTGLGGVHARVTFRLIAAGLTTLLIGSDLVEDAIVLEGGAITSATGTSYALFPGLGSASAATLPTPEPGSALLLGLGLGGLARFRTTRSQPGSPAPLARNGGESRPSADYRIVSRRSQPARPDVRGRV